MAIERVFMLAIFYLYSECCFSAGGISIQGTRVIFPQSDYQVTIPIKNTSSDDSYLIQSWVENSQGSRSSSFLVTPPLFLSGPKDNNAIRIVNITPRKDRDVEQLYYLIVKSIPSLSDKNENDSLRVSIASRIKMIVRPKALEKLPLDIGSKITAKRIEHAVLLNNPTPYVITLVELKAEGVDIGSVVLLPKQAAKVVATTQKPGKLSFRILNDLGVPSSLKVLDYEN